MEVRLMRWQEMTEGKEKYAAYLCSREWSVLKEAVKDRSNGLCERCSVNAMDHVHHLTYKRKYEERLSDLQACCRQCHDFIHAKSEFDPAKDRPIVLPWCKRRIKSFYLAGKITGSTWRESIVAGWAHQNKSMAYYQAFIDYEDCKTWAVVPSACEVLGAYLTFTGPWWSDLGGGCGHASAESSLAPHGYADALEELDASSLHARRVEVAVAVGYAIQSADLLFAWIDSDDCYGTLLEIGYAKALGKAVVVAMSESFAATDTAQEMWLISQLSYSVVDKSPLDAWQQFWNLVASENAASKDK